MQENMITNDSRPPGSPEGYRTRSEQACSFSFTPKKTLVSTEEHTLYCTLNSAFSVNIAATEKYIDILL